MRVLTAKAHVGLAANKLVDLEAVHSVVNSIGEQRGGAT